MNDSYDNVAPASESLFQEIVGRLKTERGVHIETAIAGAGYLAGVSILRATGINFSTFAPGSPVLVDSVNDEGPKLIDFMEGMCRQMGLGRDADWLVEVPDANKPLLACTELVEDLEPVFNEIVDRLQVSNELRPFVAVRTIVQFIDAGQQILDPDTGKSIATQAIVEGAKTVPPATRELAAV
jgi:hypothetical protein